MIWRKEFEIGIENIDEQHKELFERYNKLLKCIKKSDDSKEIREEAMETLEFLSEYIVYHFDSEEKYQAEINYSDINEHKKIHHNFKKTVIDFKREILKNPDFDELIKAFSGYLSTWLINHVCDEDQKLYYFINEKNAEENIDELEKPIDIIKRSVKNVFLMISQIEVNETENFQFKKNNILAIKIAITGDYEKELLFQFSSEFIVEMIKKMLNIDSVEIDSFATSALKEIVNTVAGHIINSLQNQGVYCNITIPELAEVKDTESQNILFFDSVAGNFKLFLLEN